MIRSKNPRKTIAVIISGMSSVGKTTAADVIAEKYHLTHVAGGDMLKEMAVERGYKPSGSDWWDTPEGMKFLSERKLDSEFDKEVDRRLAEYIKKGNVVITSYPMPWLAGDDALKIWFEASQKNRADRLAARDSVTKLQALEIIKKRDRQNKRIYKKLYGIRFGDDLTPFNFVVDTNKMAAKEVAKAACKLVGEYLRTRTKRPSNRELVE
ncbi:MAG TPA: cytidylate kinase family protein [Nitrososphaerales archaeon]|nr:cytidylate kinase family protein [Nitrososphaerales archaeon]